MITSINRELIKNTLPSTYYYVLINGIDFLSKLGYDSHEDEIDSAIDEMIKNGDIKINMSPKITNIFISAFKDVSSSVGLVTDDNIGLLNISIILESIVRLNSIDIDLMGSVVSGWTDDMNNEDKFISYLNQFFDLNMQMLYDSILEVSDELISVIEEKCTTAPDNSVILKNITFKRLVNILGDDIKNIDISYINMFSEAYSNNETLDRIIKSYVTVIKRTDVKEVSTFIIIALLATSSDDDLVKPLFTHLVGLIDPSISDNVVSNVLSFYSENNDVIKLIRNI